MKNKPKDSILRQLSDEYVGLDLRIKDLRKEADNLSSKIKRLGMHIVGFWTETTPKSTD